MKNLFKGLISASKGLSDTVGSFNLIADKTWSLISSMTEEKVNYIFRSKNDELLVSLNGDIKKANGDI